MTEVFGHLWGTAETRDMFEDAGRTRIWLAVIGALAAEQGELGLIPEPAAREIAERAERPVDLEEVALETRRSGHSTLGLIHVLQHDLGDVAARVGVLRRDGPGRRRHVDRPRRAADARDRRARPRGDRDVARRARRSPPGDGDAGPHARPAGAADHVRLQGRGVGGRGAPPPRARRAGAAAARGRAAGRCGRHAGGLGHGRAGAAAAGDGAPRARRPGRELDQRARPGGRADRAAGDDHRDAREDRQRGLQPPARRDRGARRGSRRPASSGASRCRRSAIRSAPSTW